MPNLNFYLETCGLFLVKLARGLYCIRTLHTHVINVIMTTMDQD